MNQAREELRRMWSGIEGVRLQPLVSLETGEQMGQEVLALLSPGIAPDAFFRSFSARACLSQFFDQMDFVAQMNFPGLSFLNLPVRSLGDEECIRRLSQVRPCYRQNLVIELQDPVELIISGDNTLRAVTSGISSLRYSGWQLWLDDMTTGVCRELGHSRLRFDGVKLDRREMARRREMTWKKLRGDPLGELVRQARELVRGGGDNVLIEGIETKADLADARKSGARWGQGYLWPETRINLRHR